MGLLDKFFRTDRNGPVSVPPSGTRFQDSEPDTDDGRQEQERNTHRKELIMVTLRETMRRHAVPSDWMEVRMLPVVNRKGRNGLHVQLVVKEGQASLLNYIPAFQSSLMAEIEKFEPRAWDWLQSISWQFAGITATSGGELPGAGQWRAAAVGGATAAAGPATHPGDLAADDDVAQDLQALFAIRDAALQQAAPGQTPPDFEPTRPGFGNTDGGPGR
jgi:hypothetical protein